MFIRLALCLVMSVAMKRDELPNHAFGTALGVAVGGVDEINAGGEGRIDDAPSDRLIRLFAEHHGAEADRRYRQSAVAKASIFHCYSPYAGSQARIEP